MPQRLRDLSQAWGELAVRGFEQSAKSVADRNDRDRENLRYIGASVAAGITNKKQKERQDRLRAEENAREDKIRAEQYARQDKRYAVEDARSAEHRQFERDTAAVKWTADARDAAAKEYAEATTPEAAQTAADRLRQYSAQYDQLMGRLTGFAKSQEQAAPPVVSPDAEVIGAPTSKPMSKGDPNRIPYTQPFATGPSAMLNVPAGPRAMPIPPAPEMPPSVVPSGSPRAEAPMPDLLPEERAVMGYQQRQAAAEKRQASALALASRLDADARSAKTELRAADLRRQAQAARDAAAAAQEDSSTAGNLAAQFSEKAKIRKTEMARETDRVAKVRQVAAVAKTKGAFVTGAFLRAITEGVTDPQLLMAVVAGAEKPPKETSEQKGVEAARTEIAKRQTMEAAGMGKATPDEMAKSLKSARGKWANAIKYESTFPGTLDALSEQMDDAELQAGANDPTLGPKATAWFKKAYSDRMQMSAGVEAPHNGSAPEGGAAAPADGGAKQAAAAEFKALPPEQQTPEAWARIKKAKGL